MHLGMRTAAAAAMVPALVLGQTPPTDVTLSPTTSVRIERLASLEFPWGMAFLPDGRLLVTEKPGRLRVFAGGKLSPSVENVPKVAWRGAMSEQGGLLDVAVDPDFAQTRLIYLSYSEEAAQGSSQSDAPEPRFGKSQDLTDRRLMGGAVMRARLDGTRLTDAQVIWRQEPKTIARGHFGHRIVLSRD